MGIRIHKVLGYGLPKCKYGKDPRVKNKDLFSGEGIRDVMSTFLKFLKIKEVDAVDSFNIKLTIGRLSDLKKTYDMYNCIHYNYYNLESKSPNGPMVISLPHNENHRRYDDDIDYCECIDQADSVKIIPHGIYPYSGTYIDSRTGQRLTITDLDVGYWRVNEITSQNFEGCKDKSWNFKTYKEFKKYTTPMIPPEIELFCECFDFFVDPLTVYQLKPMIYTYWS